MTKISEVINRCEGGEFKRGDISQAERQKGMTVVSAEPAVKSSMAKKEEGKEKVGSMTMTTKSIGLAKKVVVSAPAGGEFKPPTMRVFRTLKSQIEEARENLRQLQETMTGTATEAGLAQAIRDNILMLREYLALPREEREAVKDHIAGIMATLAEIANYPIKPVDYRMPSRLVYLDALIREWPKGHIHTVYSLRKLCKEELVRLNFFRYVNSEEEKNGVGIRIAENVYALADEYGQKTEARESFKEFCSIWQECVRRQRTEFNAEMEEALKLVGNNHVNQDQAKTGKEGRGIWNVKDHSFFDRMTGQTKMFRGGKAVFEIKDGQVGILMGLGVLKTVAKTVSDVTIPVTQIGTERLELSYREENQDLFRKQKLLHSLTRRALKAWKDGAPLREQMAEEFQKAKTAAEKYAEELQKEATLTPEAFQEEGSEGTLACTSWRGKFVIGREKRRTIVSPHFLLEKRLSGEVRVVRYALENEWFFWRYTNYRPLAECGQLKVLIAAAGVKNLLRPRDEQKEEITTSRL